MGIDDAEVRPSRNPFLSLPFDAPTYLPSPPSAFSSLSDGRMGLRLVRALSSPSLSTPLLPLADLASPSCFASSLRSVGLDPDARLVHHETEDGTRHTAITIDQDKSATLTSSTIKHENREKFHHGNGKEGNEVAGGGRVDV